MGPKKRPIVAERQHRGTTKSSATGPPKKRTAQGNVSSSSPTGRRSTSGVSKATTVASPTRKSTNRPASPVKKQVNQSSPQTPNKETKETKEKGKAEKPEPKSSKEKKVVSGRTSSRENLKKEAPSKPENKSDTTEKQDSSTSKSRGNEPKDEKAKAINKMLKNLDIKISGFDNILPKEERIAQDLKASISENVKTKSRAAAVKVIATLSNPKPLNMATKRARQEDKVQTVTKPEEIKCNLSDVRTELEESKVEAKAKEEKEKDKEKEKEKDQEKELVIETKKKMAAKKAKIEANQKTTEEKQTQEDSKSESLSKSDNSNLQEESVEPKMTPKKRAIAKTAKNNKKAEEQKNVQKITEEPKSAEDKEKIKPVEPPDPPDKMDKTDKKTESKDIHNEKQNQSKTPKKTPSPKKAKLLAAQDANEKECNKSKVDKEKEKEAEEKEKEKEKEETLKVSITIIDSNTEVVQMDIEEMPEPVKIVETKVKDVKTKTEEKPFKQNEEEKLKEPNKNLNEKVNKDNEKPEKTTDEQKKSKPLVKYKMIGGQAKTIVNKSIKVNTTLIKKDKEKEQEKEKKAEEKRSESKNDSIYDFKSGSEEEENIKMELPTLKNLREFSDEDNKPLRSASTSSPKGTPKKTLEFTKKGEKETKTEKNTEADKSNHKETITAKEESEKIPDKSFKTKVPKQPVKGPTKLIHKIYKKKTMTGTVVKAFKKGAVKTGSKAIKKVVPNKKKKELKSDHKTSEESSSSSSDSEDEQKLIMFGPKRHRMASLNALAKVQCLYENESRTAYELGLSKATQLPPRIRTVDGSDDEKAQQKLKDCDKDEQKSTVKSKKSDKEESEEDEPEVETKRELRNVAGGRGFGKHWEFDSDEGVDDEDDIMEKIKTKKKKMQKKTTAAQIKKDNEKEKERAKEREKKTALISDGEEKEKEKEAPRIKRKYTKIKKPLKKLVKSKLTSNEDKNKEKDKDNDKNSSDDEADLTKDKSKSISADKEKDKEKAQKVAKLEVKKPPKKRKRLIKEELIGDYKGILARKRMASLNASAIVAATYEVERHLDKNLAYGSYGSSSDELAEHLNKKSKDTYKSGASTKKSLAEEIQLKSAKDSKDAGSSNNSTITTSTAIVKDSNSKAPTNLNEESNDSKYSKETKETQNTDITNSTSTTTTAGLRDSTGSIKDGKETSRPTSSSVVIVQDTDVTITGVYVNATTGSSQESYCKMQYRVQSSVTEERVVRPGSAEPPPKSYTPLSALSSMLPPGTGGTAGESHSPPLPTAQPTHHHQHVHQPTLLHQQPIVCGASALTDPLAAAAAGIYHAADLGIHTEHGAPDHPHHGPPLPQTGPPPSYSAAAAAAAAAAYHAHHMSPAGASLHPHHHQHQYGHPHASPHHHPYGGSGADHAGMHHGPPGPPPPPHHYAGGPPSHYGPPPPQGRCDVGSPPPSYRPASAYPHVPTSVSSNQPLPPPIPPTVGSGSSAFCAPNIMHHHQQQIQQQQQQHSTAQQASQQQLDSSGYYQPAGPLISPHVLPPVATGPPPPLTNVSLLPATTAASAGSATSKKQQIPTPLGSDPEHLHPAPPSTASAADSTDSDVLITGGDLTPFRYPASTATGTVPPHHPPSPHQQQHQLHQQAAAAAAAHPGSPYQRSMHAAQMHYLTAYPPNYYAPYPGEAMCYSPPAAAYQPYFPTKVYQSAPPHPPPGAYRRYPYYQPGPPPPADLYEPAPPPPTNSNSSGGLQAVPPPSQGASQAPQPQSTTGSQLVPAGPAAHAQHLEHYPGPPGYYSGYSPGSTAAGQCYSRSIQGPYMEYPPQCPCPMQQSCPKNVHTGPHIGSNNGNPNCHSSSSNNITSITSNSGSNTTAMSHNNNSNNNSVVNGSQSSSNNNNSNNGKSTINLTKSNTPTNANSSSNNSNMMNTATTNRGPVQIVTSQQPLQQQQQQTQNEATRYVNSYHQRDLLETSVKSELKTEESDCKSQYEDHVVQPPTPPESYGTNDDKSLLIEDDIIDEAMEKLEMSRLTAETVPTAAITTQHTVTNATIATTSPEIVPRIIEAYDLTTTTPPLMSTTATTACNGNSNSKNNIIKSTPNSQQSLVGRKARIGKTMAREMVYAAAVTTTNTTNSPQQQQQQQPLIQVRNLPQQNATIPVATASSTIETSTTSSPTLTTSTASLTTLPLLATIKTEIKAEHIKMEDEIMDTILRQQHISSTNGCNIPEHNELKIKAEPLNSSEAEINSSHNVVYDILSRLQTNQADSDQQIQQESTDVVDTSTIVMPKPINEGPMRLWQQSPKVNCEIDLSIVSDDDAQDHQQSASQGDNSNKRMKILDFQNTCKKSSPNSYKNLIKQAEPKAYLCLSRRRLDKRNRYGLLQRKSLANGSVNVRRRHVVLTDQQKECLKIRRKKLIALERKRQEFMERKREEFRQRRIEARQAEQARAAENQTNEKEQEQQNRGLNKTNMLITDSSLIGSTTQQRLKGNPKASPKRATKVKKSSAIPMHLLETNDAVARGYFSEPETRCSSVIGSKYSFENDANARATSSIDKSALAEISCRKQKKTQISISEKRSKSETKKPIKVSSDLYTFPKPDILCLQTKDHDQNSKEVTVKPNISATNTYKLLVEEDVIRNVNNLSTISNGKKSKSTVNKVGKDKEKEKEKKRKETKPNSRKKLKRSAKVVKSKLKTKSKKIKKRKTADIDALSISYSTLPIEQLEKDLMEPTENSDQSIPRETNNNEIIEKPATIVDVSSQTQADCTNHSATEIHDNTTSQVEPTDDDDSTAIQPAEKFATSLTAVTTQTHSDKAQVFLQPALPPRILCHSHHYHGKRTRSRAKFGPRKRQKQKHSTVSYELDERPPPALRGDVAPKWNNGWTWEGEPFQGAVFLNSDDPLVIRTCYYAMRHSEGDIIRTRDCVLLKANEDNELPYVAKVAHLWENPEDGEMMVSLLWYYRPEHTEQGRQPSDSPDEVYASRHRDHNSVACIEDKCYVLTFSEYCRYRRRLRATEEDIEDVSIVPKPASSFYSNQKVPDNTNPELVMFCHRAYEFRSKRLLKMPNKQDYYVVNA